jgi:hypothetical protein
VGSGPSLNALEQINAVPAMGDRRLRQAEEAEADEEHAAARDRGHRICTVELPISKREACAVSWPKAF